MEDPRYLYILWLSVCLFFGPDWRQNGSTDRSQILCVGVHMTPEKVYETSKLEKNPWKIIGFFLNAPVCGKIKNPPKGIESL